MGCNTTKAFGLDNKLLGLGREQFKKTQAGLRRLMKAVNPALVLGKYGHLHALRSIAMDRASVAFLGSGDIAKFVGQLSPVIEVHKKFKAGLKKLSDVDFGQYAIGGRNYFMQAAGGGTHDNIFTRMILWPNRMVDLAQNHYAEEKLQKLQALYDKHNIEPRSEKAKLLGKLLDNDPDAMNVGGASLEMLNDFRAVLDEIHAENNAYRRSVNRDEIKYRKNYFPHIMSVSQLMGILGKDGAQDVVQQATNPDTLEQDFLKDPTNLVNTASAKKRGDKVNEYSSDPTYVLSRYVMMMSKDIFENEAARHNWHHIMAVKAENMAREQAIIRGEESLPPMKRLEADLIEYTAVRYQNRDPLITREFEEKMGNLPGARPVRDAAVSVHHQLIQAVFPFNWKWSLLIQPQSALLIPVRYGVKSTITAARTLFTNPEFRSQVVNGLYAGIIKKGGGGGSFVEQTTGGRNDPSDRRYGPRGRVAEFLMEKGGGGFVRHFDAARSAGVWLSDAVETNLSILAAGAAKISGEQQGLKGRALQEYMSDGIAKTQSMYNFADRAGFLQAKEVGALVPFQSFMTELFNYSREAGLPIKKVRNVLGRTGAYEEFDTTSKVGALEVSRRIQAWTYLVGGAFVANLLTNSLDDREPWQIQNFVPFASVIFGTGVGNRSAILPVAYTADWAKALNAYIEFEDPTKTRDIFMRYHMMGGLQARRTLTGLEAIYHGGVKDRRGNTMVRIGPDDAFAALLNGPWKTGPGREYWDRREG